MSTVTMGDDKPTEEDAKLPPVAAASPSAAEKEEEDSVSASVPESEESPDKAVKKRTWKKPKDKPKRPLSAYNIFFQHARTRIVDGFTEEATPEEVVRSIERILSKSREKRRHRKSHGRISFGDLARAIADQWKAINPKLKEIFDHYAEVDMIRYRREVKVWKEKKELESEANAMAKHSDFINSMNSSFNSTSSELEALPHEGSASDPRAMHESFNSSYSSTGDSASAGRRRMQADSMNLAIQRQQQILRQQLNGSGGIDFANNNNNNMMGNNRQATSMNNTLPGSQAFHQSFSSLPAPIAEFEPSSTFQMPQTMQQLGMQQERQLEQMRQLQMQQLQIQQQIEMQKNQFRQNVGMHSNNMNMNMNMNNNSMGQQSWFSDIRSPPFLTPQPTEMPLKPPSSVNTSLDQSMHLGDALHGPSAHVSDYSNSHASGFASTRSLGGMSFSDGTMAGSFNNDMQVQQQQQLQQQQYAFMQQQHNSFSGPFGRMGLNHQQGGGDHHGGFNNNNNNNMVAFSNNDDNDVKLQHDLTGLMDSSTNMES